MLQKARLSCPLITTRSPMAPTVSILTMYATIMLYAGTLGPARTLAQTRASRLVDRELELVRRLLAYDDSKVNVFRKIAINVADMAKTPTSK
jgi:hypothetical protein